MIDNNSSLEQANLLVISTAVAFTVLGALSFTTLLFIYRRTASRSLKLLVIATIACALFAAPIAINLTISALNRTSGAAFMMIDPGWLLTVAPGVISLFAAILLNRWRGRSQSAGG